MNKLKKIISLFLSAIMILSLITPIGVYADNETHTLTSQLTINSSNVNDYNNDIITGTLNGELTTSYLNSVIVIDGVEVNLTFKDLSITDNSYTGRPVVQIKNGGRLNLTLYGTNYIKGHYGGAGIEVTAGNTLDIKDASTGTLTVIGGDGFGGGAGIGASSNQWAVGYENYIKTQSVGTIIISGGNITAKGGTFTHNGFKYSGAAGIGGSGDSMTGTIIIKGGNIHATGGFSASGIGGGYSGHVESISITGGQVNATAGNYGSAIGSGTNANSNITIECGHISIQNGTVIANGNIGYAEKRQGDYAGGSVTISDDVFLSINNGVINPNNSHYQEYNVNINVYDVKLVNNQDVLVSLSHDGNIFYSYNTTLDVNNFKGTTSFRFYKSNVYLNKNIDVSVKNSNYSWNGQVTLVDNTKIELNDKLNLVTLRFISNHITSDITDYQLSIVHKDGATLDESDIGYIQGIKCIADKKGEMQVYLKEGTYKVSITVPSLNNGNKIEKEITVTTGTNSINMLYEIDNIMETIDLTYGNILFSQTDGDYFVQYYDSTMTQKTIDYLDPSIEYEVVQSSDKTANSITIEKWGQATPLKLKIHQLNVEGEQPIKLVNSNVNLYISGESTLKGTNHTACIDVANNTLRIDGTGILNITSISTLGGISGNDAIIIVNGGTIKLDVSSIGSGIGSQINGQADIIINDGRIEGTTSANGSVIGSHNDGSANITVNGGNIIASTSGDAAAIGGKTGTLTVNGGRIEASTSSVGPAIGANRVGNYKVHIKGGEVIAKTLYSGAAIGSGSYQNSYCDVVIDGGKVEAISDALSTNLGSAIGSGIQGSSTITINGGYVKAFADSKSAAIGGGYISKSAVNIKITSGTINASNTTGNGMGDSIGGGTDFYNKYPGEMSLVITGGNILSNKTYTPVNNSNQTLSLTTLSLDGLNEDVSVSAINTIPSYYGLKDVQTIDGKLYLYLPDDSSIVLNKVDSTITANNQIYNYYEASSSYSNKQAVSITGEDMTVTYDGSEIDVSQMFTIDPNAGQATYFFEDDITLNGSMLEITQVGVFKITVKTEATDLYAAGQCSAYLTINKASTDVTVSINDWIYGRSASAINISTHDFSHIEIEYKGIDNSYISTSAPTNVGKYQATIKLINSPLYMDIEKTCEFEIKPKDLSHFDLSNDNFIVVTYNGENQTPSISVYDHDINTELNENTDYIVTYANNKNAGTAQYTITGIGNYKGTCTGEFTIKPKALEIYNTVVDCEKEYDGTTTANIIHYGDLYRIFSDDEVFIISGEANYATSDIDPYGNTKITFSNYILGGKDSHNYSIRELPIPTYGAIYSKDIILDVTVADKQYDGTTNATITSVTIDGIIAGDEVALNNGTARFAISSVDRDIYIILDDFSLSGKDAYKYEIIGYKDTTADIYNTFDANENKEYTISHKDWTNQNIEVIASEDYLLSLDEITWSPSLTLENEGEREIEFYVKDINTNAISLKETVSYKIDTTAPYGTVEINDNKWNTLLNNITFGLLFNKTQTIEVSANDDLSGIKFVEYYESSKSLTLEEVDLIKDWTKLTNNKINVSMEDAKQFIYYIKLTDNAGNITYLSTDGAEYDITAPTITGIVSGTTYYVTQNFNVNDKNLDKIIINDQEVVQYILEGNIEKTYVITAYDKAGNETTYTINMLPISILFEDININNAKSNDLEKIIEIKEILSDIDDTYATDGEKAEITEYIKTCDSLVEEIEKNISEIQKITEIIKSYDEESIKINDKEAIEDLIEDIDKLIENKNLTSEENKKLEEIKQKAQDLISIIKNLEEIIDKIKELPETVVPDDLETVNKINEIEKQYNNLSNHEKSLINKELIEKLASLIKQSIDYKIIEGDNGIFTKEITNNLKFKANGAYNKFIEIKINNKTIDSKNYIAESESTLITLKNNFLNELSAGKHTITIIYSDGEITGSFEIKNAPSSNKDNSNEIIPTGDEVNSVNYAPVILLFTSTLAIFILFKKKEKKNK